jgi:hypothetical protein
MDSKNKFKKSLKLNTAASWFKLASFGVFLASFGVVRAHFGVLWRHIYTRIRLKSTCFSSKTDILSNFCRVNPVIPSKKQCQFVSEKSRLTADGIAL